MRDIREEESEGIHNLTKRIAKGSGFLFTGTLLSKGSNFILHVILARFLGTSSYGVYVLGYTLLHLVGKFSNLGLQNGIVRFGALYKGEKNASRLKGTLLSAFLIGLSFSIFTSIILFNLSSLIANQIFEEPRLSLPLKLFSISLPFYVFMIMSAFTARAFQKMAYDVTIRNLIQPFANILFVGTAFLLGLRLLGAIYGFLFSVILSSGLGFYFIQKLFPELISDLKPKYECRKLLRFSLPVLFIGLSYFLLNQVDRMMIGYFKTTVEVGLYNAASKVAIFTALFNQSFNGIFAPIISNLFNRNDLHKLEYLFKTITRWVVTLSLPTACILILFSTKILTIFGSEYIVGWPVLSILAGCFLLSTSTGSVGFLLQMTGKQDFELMNALITLTLNIGLNLLLIPPYGVMGAAIATGLSLIFVNLLKLIEVNYLLKIQPYDNKYLKPLGAIVLTAFLGLVGRTFFHTTFEGIWPVSIVTLGLIYFYLLYIFGLSKEDRAIILAVRKKVKRFAKYAK